MIPDELPRIPGYTGISWLGAGGAADVYRAKREHLGRWVAIKVFRVALPGQDAAAQFRAECDAVIRLDREPDVIVVHDAGILPDGRPYLVSELCDGSLQQLVARRGPLSAGEASAIGQRIATALAAAHFARVLHGDVTPQNVLIRPSGAPVLADFGLAVLRDHRGNTSAGFTPDHAAPETVRHDGVLDERSDVYGLGSTLYTALTGQPPFPVRPGEPEVARLRRILHEPPARPDGVPDPLADLVLAMLAKDPSLRPAPAEVAAALSPARSTPEATTETGPRYGPPAGFPPASQARTQARAASAMDAPTDRRTDPVPAPAARRWRRPVAVLAVVAALVLVVVLGVVFRPPAERQATGVAAPTGAARIELAPPEDAGTSVTLRWTADRVLDFGVVIAERGVPAEVQLVERATTAVVAVKPGVQYCFSIQGTDGRSVGQSDAEGIRGALCRDVPF